MLRSSCLLAWRCAAVSLRPARARTAARLPRAHETRPGRYDVLWKLPSLGSTDVRMPIVPVFPETCRQLGEARSERAGTAWVFAAQVECKGGLAGQTIAIEGLESIRHRRAGARAARRRRRRDARAEAGAAVGDVARGGRRAPRRVGLPLPRHRAHPARRRPPAVRARTAADRPRPLDAGEDRDRVHARAQHHARGGDVRRRAGGGGAAQRGDRAVHPVPRSGDRARAGAARRASRSATRGSSRSPSACCTASASRAASRSSACRRARSRWRCCCSTSASRSGSSRSWSSCCCSSARSGCSRSTGRRSSSGCRATWSGRWARSGRSSASPSCSRESHDARRTTLRRIAVRAAARRSRCSRSCPPWRWRTRKPARPPASSPGSRIRYRASTTCWRWSPSAFGARCSARPRSGCCRSRFRW